ncbi:Rieske (2Fe-2S) protein [Spongisporangium articulatum]|uniref:Rieske (2Fe-2S) protein n=1 Tax=Spongisporangium articulatum TaxID=3362603 RepID=A0ABW8AHX8_9ACTN
MTATTSTYRLGPLDQIPPGEGRAFAVGAEQVAVFRLRSGAVRAVSARCTHSGGPIADGQADEHVVVCPLHLHAFDLATGCSTSGQEPLTTYDVRVEGGELVIEC